MPETTHAWFKGWIPTVSGHLSFSAIGRTNYPEHIHSATVDDTNTRLIVCYQRRTTSDALLPVPRRMRGFVARWLFADESRHAFICISRVDNNNIPQQSVLRGHIFMVIGPDDWRGGPWWHRWWSPRGCHKIMNDFTNNQIDDWKAQQRRCSRPPSNDVRSFYDTHCKSVINELLKKTHFNCVFTLERNGVLTVETGKDALTFFGLFKPAQCDRDDLQRYIATFAKQSYFFLRDILHRHQHHPADQDTILTLHRVSSIDDHGWIELSLRSLFNKVIEFKQARTRERCVSAAGVLTYYRTLAEIARRTYGDAIRVVSISDKNLEQSIGATLQECEIKETRGAERKNLWLVVFFGALAAIMACVSLLSLSNYDTVMKQKTPSPMIIELAELFMVKPFTTGVLALLVAYFVNYFSGLGIGWGGELGPYRYMVRIFQALDKPLAAAIALLMFLVGALVFAWALVTGVYEVAASFLAGSMYAMWAWLP